MLALLTQLNVVVAILVPLVEALGLYCAWRALMHSRTAQGAAAWVVSLVLQPFIAVPMYAVFGRRKFVGYVRARREGDGALAHVAESTCEGVGGCRSDRDEEVPELAALERLARLPFTSGNRADLLVDGEATFAATFAGIDRAHSYVLVQTFILRADGIGEELAGHLLRAAERGVRVLLLYDEIGSHALPRSFVDRLRAGGVSVRSFHSTRGKQNRFQLNFRNHRKVVVVDGESAFVGGHNVGDEYLGRDPEIGPWRDTHVELRGPVVLGVQLGFLEDWHWATGRIPELSWGSKPCEDGHMHALAIASGPADEFETAALMFLHLIASAHERLWITSPYFVPDDAVVQALILASMRGVDVRILLPSKPDHLLVYLSSFSYLEELESSGVCVYRYSPGFLHQKVALVDDEIACVGTANLDNRSFRLNFELSVLVHDASFAADVREMLERDFAASKKLDLSQLEERPLWFRSAVKLARLAAPIQ